MHNLKPIRDRLGVTQQALADGIECTQGNVGHYERGQEFPPDRARLLIKFAKKLGMTLTFDHVYGNAPLPKQTKQKAVA
jgi:putative transcriptional regulator